MRHRQTKKKAEVTISETYKGDSPNLCEVMITFKAQEVIISG
jgi:hypothetical protein